MGAARRAGGARSARRLPTGRAKEGQEEGGRREGAQGVESRGLHPRTRDAGCSNLPSHSSEEMRGSPLKASPTEGDVPHAKRDAAAKTASPVSSAVAAVSAAAGLSRDWEEMARAAWGGLPALASPLQGSTLCLITATAAEEMRIKQRKPPPLVAFPSAPGRQLRPAQLSLDASPHDGRDRRDRDTEVRTAVSRLATRDTSIADFLSNPSR